MENHRDMWLIQVYLENDLKVVRACVTLCGLCDARPIVAFEPQILQ